MNNERFSHRILYCISSPTSNISHGHHIQSRSGCINYYNFIYYKTFVRVCMHGMAMLDHDLISDMHRSRLHTHRLRSVSSCGTVDLILIRRASQQHITDVTHMSRLPSHSSLRQPCCLIPALVPPQGALPQATASRWLILCCVLINLATLPLHTSHASALLNLT